MSILRDANYFITKAIECKRVSDEQAYQIRVQDSLINYQADEIDIQNKQILLLRENAGISEGQARAAYEQLGQCAKDKEKSERDAVRLKKGRNFWRTTALIETAVLAGIVYLIVK